MFHTPLIATNLCASRGGFALFENVSFKLEPGEALRVTGSNGTGKTTLLRCLAGLIGPDSGRVTLLNDDAVHYLGHFNAMKPQLNVVENLEFWAKMQNGGSIQTALEKLSLLQLKDLPFNVLSAGQKRRVAFARLLLSQRPVWLLDEPTAGLDAASVALVDTVLETHLTTGGIVVAATHTPLGNANWQTLELMPVPQC